MRIVINDISLALGEVLPAGARAAAGLHRPGLWQRLRSGEVGHREHLETENCVVDAFDGGFRLYPCTDGYLNRDRQWRTAASIRLEEGRVRSVLLRVIDGRYAASEFVERFREVCSGQHGEGQAVDRRTRRWKNGATTFLSSLQPDGRNACFVFEMIES